MGKRGPKPRNKMPATEQIVLPVTASEKAELVEIVNVYGGKGTTSTAEFWRGIVFDVADRLKSGQKLEDIFSSEVRDEPKKNPD